MTLLADLQAELEGESAITDITGTRIFFLNPIKEPTGSYLVYTRELKERDIVTQNNRFQIVCFSKDTEQLETFGKAVITLLEGKTQLNGNEYYEISFLGQTDGKERLDSGFYWTILNLHFKEVI